MSKEFGDASGNNLAAFDPTYTLPAPLKSDLDTLFDALDALSLCSEAADHSEGPTVTLSHLAPLQRSLAVLGKRLLADVPAKFPTVARPQA